MAMGGGDFLGVPGEGLGVLRTHQEVKQLLFGHNSGSASDSAGDSAASGLATNR